jgi:putative oxidoreductase
VSAGSAGRTGAWGLTALRWTTGALMAGHGLQKLSTLLGGRGIDATAAGFDAMGLRPGRPHAIAAGATEALAGVASMLGVWTPAASAATTGTMTVAVAKVHGRNGPWITKGGYEYNVTLIAVAFALAAVGPGAFALDGVVTRRRTGLGWAVAQLAVGAAAATAVVQTAARRAVPPPDDAVAA